MSKTATASARETVTPPAIELCSAAVGQVPGLKRIIHQVFGPMLPEDAGVPYPEPPKAFRVNFADESHDIVKSAYVMVRDGVADVHWESQVS